MRTAWSVLLAVLVALPLAGCFQPPGTGCGTGQTGTTCPPTTPAVAECSAGTAYANVDRTYSLCIPSGWAASDHQRGQELFLYAPLEGDYDAFRENINLGRHRVPGNQTLDTYVSATLEQLPKALNEFKLLSRSNTTVGTEPAVRLQFTHALYETNQTGAVVGRLELAGVQLLVVHKEVAAVVTFTAESSKQGIFQSAADSVFSSLRFT